MVVSREEARKRRHLRVRKHVVGSTEKPRLCIKKSHRHIYVQLVDDLVGGHGSVSLLQVTTNSKEFKESGRKSFGNVEYAKVVGSKLGKLAKKKGIKRLVFDRSGYPYHGIVKACAEAVRAEGIEF
jgi:large subunit ribosomal protein L18